MVTFSELRDARVDGMFAAADAWERLSRRSAELEQRVIRELTGPLRHSGWQGGAASAAFRHLDGLDDDFELMALQARTLGLLLRRAADEFRRLQLNLTGIVDAVAQLGLYLDADGRVWPPEWTAYQDPEGEARHRRAVDNAKIYNDLVVALVERATKTDEEFNAALRRFGPTDANPWEWGESSDDTRAVAGLLGIDASQIPASSDPRVAASWWAGLSDADKHLYLAAYPDRIGELAGLPTPVRDDANRLALRDWLGDPVNPERTGGAQYARAQQLLDKLESAEYGPSAGQLYLLDVDHRGDGRAVVSVGNPDTAKHTAVLVPGVGNEFEDMPGLINRATEIQRTSDVMTAGDSDVAVVAWLGYDTPGLDSDILSAPLGGRARDGAVALDGFVDGLRTSHEGEPGHMTVIAHSYGSAVVGHAASHGDGLAVDDIVAVGSPGMRVDHASDLNVGENHVWVMAAGDDHVANPGNHSLLYRTIPVVGPWLGQVEEMVHGPAPHDPRFGAQRLGSDTSGHSDYWAPGSESLNNQARVVVGDYGG